MSQKIPTALYSKRFATLYPHLPVAYESKRQLSVRINPVRKCREEVLSRLKEAGVIFSGVSWYKDALIIQNMTAREMTELPLYKDGHLYIQTLSSMIPPLILAPSDKDRVLDMAAAPGSKTSQLAALMGNRGEIIANDIDRRRLYKLNAVLDILGVKNVQVTSLAGQSLWQKFPEAFDKVLLDAPCSMEGTLYYETVRKIKQLAKLQRWLLRSAISSVKPGGEVVYSTCSMAPEENEEVVDWVLKKEAGKIALKEMVLGVPERLPGIISWEGRYLDPSLTKTLRIPPNAGMEPFFVARLIKTSSTVNLV